MSFFLRCNLRAYLGEQAMFLSRDAFVHSSSVCGIFRLPRSERSRRVVRPATGIGEIPIGQTAAVACLRVEPPGNTQDLRAGVVRGDTARIQVDCKVAVLYFTSRQSAADPSKPTQTHTKTYRSISRTPGRSTVLLHSTHTALAADAVERGGRRPRGTVRDHSPVSQE